MPVGTKQGHRSMHPKSLANLKPWSKGVSPNPGGMPKGTYSPTTHLRRILALPAEQKAKLLSKDPTTLTLAEEMALTTLRNALAVETGRRGTSNSEAIVWERVDGRVPTPPLELPEGMGNIRSVTVREIIVVMEDER